MSRAFMKETAEGAAPPERMVSSGPNLVTEEGLAKIAAEVKRLEAALAAEANVLLRETLERDLRYWRQSQASAQVVPRPATGGAVAFGATVTFARNGGKAQTVRIVGEDEADPKAGLINFRSPLAQALIGAEQDDTVEMRAPPAQLTIVKVE
ncbi:MAG TPA: GreA/GreB family elongation factor [Rhizomicrobium sp.]|jgi:transcription elongation GreA/GreB family factor|nr:GreA/GreB family elongation factor [Rhizomicrobium sp.]